MKIIHLAADSAPTPVPTPNPGGARSFDFVASTEGENSYGFKIAAGAWDLTRYLANPVVLLDHEHELESVVGYASDVRVEDGKLLARVTFVSADANPRAEMARKLIMEGALRAMSVGFYPSEVTLVADAPVVTKAELRELSIVPVPSDPDALCESARLALVQLAAVGSATLKPEKRMDFSKILGLADGAPAEAQATEIVRLKGGEAQLLAVTGTKSLGEAAGAVEALKLAAEKGRQSEIELAAYREASVRAEHERTVDAALADGRLQPSQRAWAIGLSAETLKGFLSTVTPMRTKSTETPAPATEGLTDAEVKLCAAKGWKTEEFLAAKRLNAAQQKGA